MSDTPEIVDELEVKKRARRRLVGAVGLLLLAAIVLPLSMSRKESSQTADLKTTLQGSPDAGQEVVPDAVVAEDIPVAEPTVASVELEEPVTSVPAAPAIVQAAPAVAATVQPVPAVPAAVSATARPAPSTVVVSPPVVARNDRLGAQDERSARNSREAEREAAHQVARDAEAQRKDKARDRQKEEARVVALLNDKPTSVGRRNVEEKPKVEEKPRAERDRNRDRKEAFAAERTEKVFVQIGAFGDAARAKTLVDQLKKQGFAAYAASGGAVTRVRIGPVERSAGERALAGLKAKGHSAVLLSK